MEQDENLGFSVGHSMITINDCYKTLDQQQTLQKLLPKGKRSNYLQLIKKMCLTFISLGPKIESFAQSQNQRQRLTSWITPVLCIVFLVPCLRAPGQGGAWVPGAGCFCLLTLQNANGWNAIFEYI